MDDQANFDLNESLKLYFNDPKTLATPDADSELVDCEADPESLTLPVINSALNPIVDSIAGNADGITKSTSFDTLQFLLKCAPSSLQHQRPKLGNPKLTFTCCLGLPHYSPRMP
jgi:condensin complex subunit 1